MSDINLKANKVALISGVVGTLITFGTRATNPIVFAFNTAVLALAVYQRSEAANHAWIRSFVKKS